MINLKNNWKFAIKVVAVVNKKNLKKSIKVMKIIKKIKMILEIQQLVKIKCKLVYNWMMTLF